MSTPKRPDESIGTFSIIWRGIESFFEKWKFRFTYGGYAIAVLAFYLWILFGGDWPLSVIKWVAPLLAGVVLKVWIDTHLALCDLVEPSSIDSKECIDRMMKRVYKTARRKHTPEKPINIDVLGVALHNSHHWIEHQLQEFMKKEPKVHVELRLVFVDPDFLQNLDFNTDPIDWAEKSRERVEWVSKTLCKMARQSAGRLRIHVRIIKNLPHWHGILIERHYLFLGRVSWDDGTERFHSRPINLMCALTGYRCFERDDRQHGEERVDLFRRWMAHYLYGKHPSRDLADNISSFYGERAEIWPETPGKM